MSAQKCSYESPVRKRGPKQPRRGIRSPCRDDQARVRSSIESPSQQECPGIPVLATREPSPLRHLHRKLVANIIEQMPSINVFQLVNDYISVFFRRSFPNLPICHEPTLRSDACYFFQNAESVERIDLDEGPIALLRSFALITALCGTMAFLHGISAVPDGTSFGPLFLRASRDTLKEYEDYDLGHPNSTSLQIRMLQATCIQQHTCDKGLAAQVVAQASLLAHSLRLYSERALSQYDPLESTLLRYSFWALHMSDSSAICLNNRPMVLFEPLFDTELDTQEFGLNDVPLLDEHSAYSRNDYERTLLEGFHLFRRIFSMAAHLLIAIRSFIRLRATREPLADGHPELDRISRMYSGFVAALDAMPPSLQSSIIMLQEDDSLTDCQQLSFTTQRYRLQSMFSCAKLLVVHECIRFRLPLIIGLRDDHSALMREELNIARDFAHALQSVPFHYLQRNGEPGIELIRVVGSILLEVSDNTNDASSRQRGYGLLNTILDILAKLNSKASDKLLDELSNNARVSQHFHAQ